MGVAGGADGNFNSLLKNYCFLDHVNVIMYIRMALLVGVDVELDCELQVVLGGGRDACPSGVENVLMILVLINKNFF